MKVWKVGPKGHGLPPVELHQQDFVAKGGQASVYVKGQDAYKIYTDPREAMPEGKLRELEGIADPLVVRPELLVANDKGCIVGYQMSYVGESHALCQLFPRSFRERSALGFDAVQELVQQLRSRVQAVHAAGALVVDLNEMNVLVSKDFKRLHLIDVDSFQTPSYRATAIMDSVRDRQVVGNAFHPGSDWFSFAVLAFQMLVGVHPYKGKHPRVKGLEARMVANLSAFDSEVRLPGAAYELDVIPVELRAWLERVLQKGERSAPPDERGVCVVVPRRHRLPRGRGGLSERLLHRYPETVLGLWRFRGSEVVACETGLWIGRHRRVPKPTGFAGVAFSARRASPVAVSLCEGKVELFDLEQERPIACSLQGSELVFAQGRAYLRARASLIEIELKEAGARILATSRLVAQIMPHATRLFQGVAVQNLLGSSYLSLLAGPGLSYQRRLPELDEHHIVDARFEEGLLVVLARPRTGQKHRYDRFVFRFAADYSSYDMRANEDVHETSLELALLDSGVCVLQGGEGSFELFHSRPGPSEIKELDDELLDGGWSLVASGAGLQAYRDACLYELRMT